MIASNRKGQFPLRFSLFFVPLENGISELLLKMLHFVIVDTFGVVIRYNE
jgi:hypothetical protein